MKLSPMRLAELLSAHKTLEDAIDVVLGVLGPLELDKEADNDLDEIMSAITAASGDLEFWIKANK